MITPSFLLVLLASTAAPAPDAPVIKPADVAVVKETTAKNSEPASEDTPAVVKRR
jgi:hypothetical protein